MKIISLHSIYILLFFSLSLNTNNLNAQAVLFSEYRMILNNNQISILKLCNPTDDTGGYSISITDKKMNVWGDFIDIPDSINIPYSLKNNLKVFPKSISLDPHQCQEVQLQIKNSANLNDGEYRSYLTLSPKTASDLISDDSALPTEKKGVKINIKTKINSSIPIIYRKNISSVPVVKIDSIYISKNSEKGENNYFLNLTFYKEGSKSVYGDISIDALINNNSYTNLQQIMGNAIYAEMDKKHLKVNIPSELLENISGKDIGIKITYTDNEDNSNPKKIIIVEKEIKIPIPK